MIPQGRSRNAVYHGRHARPRAKDVTRRGRHIIFQITHRGNWRAHREYKRQWNLIFAATDGALDVIFSRDIIPDAQLVRDAGIALATLTLAAKENPRAMETMTAHVALMTEGLQQILHECGGK